MSQDPQIETRIRQHILQEFLAGENPDELRDDTPLISAGILSSIDTLKLVAFLEQEFSVSVEAHEADEEHLNTVADIAKLVRGKMG